MNRNVAGTVALVIAIMIIAAILFFEARPSNPYSKALNPSDFNLTNLISLQQQEFSQVNDLDLTYDLLISPTPSQRYSYKVSGSSSEIVLPGTESLVLLAKASNGSYIPDNYVYVNYTSVYRIGNNYYGCTSRSCFNGTSTAVTGPYGSLAVLNFTSLEGFGTGYAVHLANVHQTSYNGYPCTYFSIIRTNSSQQYQTGNVSVCMSDAYYVPVRFEYIATSGSSTTVFLNYSAVSINGNVDPSQLNLPAPVNNSELNE